MIESTRFQSASGKTGKTVAARLLPGTDLMTGIIEVCKRNNMQFASVQNCFGSFQRSGYLYLVPKPDSKIGVGYGELIQAEGPIEFLGGTGIVCQRDGDYEVHLHGTMCGQTGNVFGGHLVKGENPVITVDLILVEIEGMSLNRDFDEETGAYQFAPVGKEELDTE
ncbi:PPC domain-containing DNA-binding protein [Bacillus infantis]|uniref:PPC domain-containing DNA-binding protein n=1 Tax=Bacillus infantis TaxID=324767 RepID=UPI003CF77972